MTSWLMVTMVTKTTEILSTLLRVVSRAAAVGWPQQYTWININDLQPNDVDGIADNAT